MSQEVVSSFQEPIHQFSNQLGIQWPVQLLTEREFALQETNFHDQVHALIIKEGEQVFEEDIAYFLGRALLAEKYDPLFIEPKITDGLRYHPQREEIKKHLTVLQKAPELWALDIMAGKISPQIAQKYVQKRIQTSPLHFIDQTVFENHPNRVISQAALLEAERVRYGLSDDMGAMQVVGGKIRYYIPDYALRHTLLIDHFNKLQKPTKSPDEMLEALEDSNRFVAQAVEFPYKPSLRKESGKWKWFLDNPVQKHI